MNENLLERRQEMLKLRGKGLPLTEVVHELASKYSKAKRTLYQDWRVRKRWMKGILDLGDPETVFLDILASHKEIYQMTVMEFFKGDNSSARIGALRLMRELNRDFYDMSITPEIMDRLERIESYAKKRS